jgi:hypothetical protein
MKDFAGHARQFTALPALLALVVAAACTETGDLRTAATPAAAAGPEAAQRYLAQQPPGTVPEVFAPGVVSTEAVELNSVFTPDGSEFFFTRLIEGPDEQEGYPGKTRPILHHSVYEDGAWTEPQPLRLFPGAAHAWAADMSVSPDGERLYFMGAHPVDADGKRNDLNIWVSHRADGAWATAEPLPYPVNTEFDEVYSSVVADGSLYFTAYSTSEIASGRSGLYRAQALNDGGFAEPVEVDIEWAHRIGDTFVAPDESYLILSARLPGSDRGEDLHVSFRNADGGWDEPINLGPAINSDGADYCPMVTPDGKYLFFSRSRADPPWGWPNVVAGDIYWVDAAVIDRLSPTPGVVGHRTMDSRDPSATVDELVSSGELGLVSDAELRVGPVQFREQARLANEPLNHARSELSDYVPLVHLKLLFEPDSAGLFGSRIADYDFNALAADPEVVNAVGLSRRMLVAVAINHASPLAQARRLQLHMERTR